MKRKLFSTLLCAFALLLLMGAGVGPDSAALVIEEESTSSVLDDQVLETGIPAGEEENIEAQVQPEEKTEPAEIEDEDTEEDPTFDMFPEMQNPVAQPEASAVDAGFLVDGQPVSSDTDRELINGVTYVALAPTVKALADDAQVSWDGASGVATVTTPTLTLTAEVGQFYVVANGRYLYIQDGVQIQDNRVIVPLRVLTEAFDATLNWDGATNTVSVTRGSGALVSGDSFYNQDDLFWLSRIIYAESGNQPLKGKMAVGNVILNRVFNPAFPDTIIDVLAQKNQFTTYRGGKLANRTPNESSIIAAKLVLDGGVVQETAGALYFDSQANSWAARSKTCLTVIGGHTFYR